LHLLIACCISVFLSAPGFAARRTTPAATVILLEGDLHYFENGHRHKLDLGQLLGRDCEIQSSKDGSVHLVLANGSSLIVGPNSDLKLQTPDLPPARPRYKAKLLRGQLTVLADEADGALTFDLSSGSAAVVFKKAHFEMRVSEGTTQVTVDQGSVQFGDLEHKRMEDVPAFHECSLFDRRLDHANRLSKREAGAFRQRLQRSLMIHGQRAELMKHLKGLN
jgi:ferric-dicitrate binding protein FerR (iron transport regulator)